MTATPAHLPSWTAHLPTWMPSSLDDLRGPYDGVVELPLIVCWSGRNTFDLSRFTHRVQMYEVVIVQGGPEHYIEFLNREHLVEMWPLMHRRLGEGYMQAWEGAFPELARLGADKRLWHDMLVRLKKVPA